MSRVTLSLAFAGALAVLSATASGVIINVPGDSATIQKGIDGALPGDTVLVAPGIYTGVGNRWIDLRGKQLLVVSESGADSTIIDCEGLSGQTAFTLSNGEDSLTIIDGFTLTGAADTGFGFGAIICNSASPTIRNCVITQNDCNGFYGYQSSAIIENCLISDNSSSGVYSFAGFPIRIRDCEISGNGYTGVSIAWGSSGLEMSNCLVKDNAEHGLAIYTMIENYFVTNCTFVGNRIGMEFWFVYPKSGTIEPSFDSTAVMNSIFAYNSERGLELDISFTIEAIMRCNNSYGNPGGDYVHGMIDSVISFGNISLDPQFCSYAGGDFSLIASSPCSPDHNSCGVLMGAFPVDSTCGSSCCVDTTGNIDADPNEDVNVADLTYLVDYLFRGGPPPPCTDEADVDSSGGNNVADLTYLVDYLFRGGPAPVACP